MHDSALVKRILNGDRASGERLVTVHYPRIFRFLRCLTGSADTAQDLTQQTFAQAWQALSSYRGAASLATWLHKIGYHEYTHWLRAQHDNLPLESAAEIEDLREVHGLDSILISRALAFLPADQKETFLLYYMQEFSVKEVAAMLDLPAGTVKSRLFTARQRMRELLQASEAPLAAASPIECDVRLLLTGIEGGHL